MTLHHIFTGCFEANKEYVRDDIGFDADAESAMDCQRACAKRTGCTHFSFITREVEGEDAKKGCLLKSSNAEHRTNSAAISGPVDCELK